MKRLEECNLSEKVTPERLARLKAALSAYRYADNKEVFDFFCRDLYTLFWYDVITLKDRYILIEFAFELREEMIRDNAKN